LGWICDNAQLHVTKQCKLQFEITSSFIDEVELDVVPLDICGMVLGSPYLYDKKAIFYREQNKYHIFKDGIEFIVRAHQMKTNLTVVTTGHMKMLVNIVSKIHIYNLRLKVKQVLWLMLFMLRRENMLMVHSLSHLYIQFCLFSLLLINGVCLVVATMNGRVCEFKGMINLVNNVVSVFVIVVMSHDSLSNQDGWMILDK
jgi:hypothetical protein